MVLTYLLPSENQTVQLSVWSVNHVMLDPMWPSNVTQQRETMTMLVLTKSWSINLHTFRLVLLVAHPKLLRLPALMLTDKIGSWDKQWSATSLWVKNTLLRVGLTTFLAILLNQHQNKLTPVTALTPHQSTWELNLSEQTFWSRTITPWTLAVSQLMVAKFTSSTDLIMT